MIYQCGSCERIFHELVDGSCPHCGSGNFVEGYIDDPKPRKPLNCLEIKDHEVFEDEYCGYIGLSLSGCIVSIARHEVSMKDVMAIISRTDLDNPEQAYEVYSKTSFDGYDKEHILIILRQMWTRLVQPRQFYGMTPVGNYPWIRIPAYPGEPYKGVRE